MAKTPVPPAAPPAKPSAGPVTGVFAEPPAHAPRETTQPLDASVIQGQLAKAAANEKELQPLQFAIQKAVAAAAGAPEVPVPGGVVTAPPQAAPDTPAGSAHLGVPTPSPVVPPSPAPAPLPDGTAPLGELTKVHQPAASNTDSPSRGVPKPQLDPGKVITGGWGHGAMGQPQYFALDGSELRALILTLWKDIEDRMAKDLRFMMACTYPRVMARITVDVCGATPDAAINDVAFQLETRIIEFVTHAVDDQETPADALRDIAGLDKPFKHLVQTTTGQIIVDKDVDLSAGK
jgi:hypothetical protein